MQVLGQPADEPQARAMQQQRFGMLHSYSASPAEAEAGSGTTTRRRASITATAERCILQVLAAQKS
jgi:hypothetical protein